MVRPLPWRLSPHIRLVWQAVTTMTRSGYSCTLPCCGVMIAIPARRCQNSHGFSHSSCLTGFKFLTGFRGTVRG